MLKTLTTSDIKEFEIDLTGTCNLQCPLCTRNYSHAQHLLKKNVRPVKDIIKQLDFFPNLTRIMLAGAISEPLLYPELPELIEYFNSRNIHIDMFSNGSLQSTEYWESLGKLFKQGHERSSCTFTLCGSSQEVNAEYRVGSDLSKILNNAKAFKLHSNRDILQIIEFKYNTEDLKSEAMNDIVKGFSHSYIVGTEGRRRLTEHVKEVSKEISPLITRENAINTLFNRRKKVGDAATIECKAFNTKKMHINQFGQMHYCYISMEFPESKDDFLCDDPTKLHKDYIFDYTKIFEFTYPDCFLCEAKTKKMIEISGLDFVC
jgi:organic radical activating enzyme